MARSTNGQNSPYIKFLLLIKKCWVYFANKNTSLLKCNVYYCLKILFANKKTHYLFKTIFRKISPEKPIGNINFIAKIVKKTKYLRIQPKIIGTINAQRN